jgi:hypothetical protein
MRFRVSGNKPLLTQHFEILAIDDLLPLTTPSGPVNRNHWPVT